MEDIREESPPKKRGRGRPPGSLNKKTLAKIAEASMAETSMAEAAERDSVPSAQDSAAEETMEREAPPSVTEAAASEEEIDEVKPEAPKPKKKPKESDSVPLRSIEADEPTRLKRKVTRATRAPKESTPEMPQDYLGFLRRTMELQRAHQRAEKSARYDSYFRTL